MHDRINGVFEGGHQQLRLLALVHKVFLVHNSLLAELILVDLGLQSLSGGLKHCLLPVLILLEYLLNLGSDSLGICILIRVCLKDLKDFPGQLLIVYEGLFEIAEPRLLPGTDHRRAYGPAMTAQELHLCLPPHHALVPVLDGGAFGALHLLPGGRRYAVLVSLRSVIHALLAVEALPEGVLHGLPVINDDYVGRRVDLLTV